MPTLKPLLFLLVASALAGGLRAFRLLAARRRADETVQALHHWIEEPLSSWRYEPYSAAAVLVHTLAVCVLSLAALSAATKPATFAGSLLSSDSTMVILVWLVECGSMALIGYLVGSLLAFPIHAFKRAPVPIAIVGEGVVHGRTLLPWRWFSHFAIDTRRGVLRLYSAFSPDLPSLIFKPPASTPLARIEDTLQEYLPKQPATAARARYRTKYFLIPTMILACLPLDAVGWLAVGLPRELALFGIAVGAAILMVLGGRIVSLFAFGVFKLDAGASPSHPAA